MSRKIKIYEEDGDKNKKNELLLYYYVL